jgi:hypothetical protein
MGKGKENERTIKSIKSKRRQLQGQINAPGRFDNTNKNKLKLLIQATAKAAPTSNERKAVAKNMKRRAEQGKDGPSAKNTRKKQHAQRKIEDEIAVIKQALKRPISLASNVSAAIAKPPHLFTNEWKIKAIRRTGMIQLVLNELKYRYSEEELILMKVLSDDRLQVLKTITELKNIMHDYENRRICTCHPNAVRGPACRCKKADIFKLHCTKVEEWKNILENKS